MKLTRNQILNTIDFLQNGFIDLILQIGGIEDSDEYWEDVTKKCDECYKKYNTEFAKAMIIALAGYLEDCDKKKRTRRK